MTAGIIRFLNIIMVALVAGSIFGIWLGYDPRGFSAPTFIEQQQNAITNLNILMPILGFTAILLTLSSAFLQKKRKSGLRNVAGGNGFSGGKRPHHSFRKSTHQ